MIHSLKPPSHHNSPLRHHNPHQLPILHLPYPRSSLALIPLPSVQLSSSPLPTSFSPSPPYTGLFPRPSFPRQQFPIHLYYPHLFLPPQLSHLASSFTSTPLPAPLFLLLIPHFCLSISLLTLIPRHGFSLCSLSVQQLP